MAVLTFDTYGKTRVRLLQVRRDGARHGVTEMTVQVLFEGDLAESYTAGDNRKILPTDTMKNTVYALARRKPIASAEGFACDLGRHFLSRLAHVHQVKVEISETPWNRIADHGSAFTHGGHERRTAACVFTRSAHTVVSGLRDLQILKTADSGFSGYLKDEYTTLPETTDRLLGTILDADWTCSSPVQDFNGLHAAIRSKLLDVFAAHHSLSVQHTLFAMARSVIDRFAEVDQIHLVMPNTHCLLIDLSKFGLDNPNQIFMPVDEPSGLIEAKVSRD
ncbi:MAG TPA: urate oxidase [Bryobacteraceae bacterium]|jgi:urate oxidase